MKPEHSKLIKRNTSYFMFRAISEIEIEDIFPFFSTPLSHFLSFSWNLLISYSFPGPL